MDYILSIREIYICSCHTCMLHACIYVPPHVESAEVGTLFHSYSKKWSYAQQGYYLRHSCYKRECYSCVAAGGDGGMQG